MKRIYLIIILILLLIIDNTILPSYFIGGVYPSFLFVFAMAYSIIRGKKEAVFIETRKEKRYCNGLFQGFICTLRSNRGQKKESERGFLYKLPYGKRYRQDS